MKDGDVERLLFRVLVLPLAQTKGARKKKKKEEKEGRDDVETSDVIRERK